MASREVARKEGGALRDNDAPNAHYAIKNEHFDDFYTTSVADNNLLPNELYTTIDKYSFFYVTFMIPLSFW